MTAKRAKSNPKSPEVNQKEAHKIKKTILYTTIILGILILTSTAQGATTLTDQIILNWDFISDSSDDSNNASANMSGFLINSPVHNSGGDYNGFYNFSADDNDAIRPANLFAHDSSQALTFAGWFYAEKSCADASVYNYANFVNFDTASGSDNAMLFCTVGQPGGGDHEKPGVYSSGSGYKVSSTKFGLNQWNHIAYVYTGSRMLIYLNGTLTLNTTFVLTSKTAYMTIGGRWGPTHAEGWTGRYAQFNAWDRALSTDEVTELYNGHVFLAYPFEVAPPVVLNSSIVWLNQSPADLTAGSEAEADYNVTVYYNYTMNSSYYEYPYLNFTVNSNRTDCWIRYGRVCYKTFGFTELLDNFSSEPPGIEAFRFTQDDFLPAIYNIDVKVLETTQHQAHDLNLAASAAMIYLYNISIINTGSLEAMYNATSAGQIETWVCNSTYNNNLNYKTSSNCALLFENQNATTYNHTDTGFSSHQVTPTPINETSRKMAGIKVTSPMKFIISATMTGTGLKMHYIPNPLGTNVAYTTTNNGASWTSRDWIFDTHFHQITGNETVTYKACALNQTNTQYDQRIRSNFQIPSSSANNAILYLNYSIPDLAGDQFVFSWTVGNDTAIVQENYTLNRSQSVHSGQIDIQIRQQYNFVNPDESITTYVSYWNGSTYVTFNNPYTTTVPVLGYTQFYEPTYYRTFDALRSGFMTSNPRASGNKWRFIATSTGADDADKIYNVTVYVSDEQTLNCSETTRDVIDKFNLPPTAARILRPVSFGNYSRGFFINWTAAESIGGTITGYNVSLYYANDTLAASVVNTSNLYYFYDGWIGTLSNGEYYLTITAYDSNGLATTTMGESIYFEALNLSVAYTNFFNALSTNRTRNLTSDLTLYCPQYGNTTAQLLINDAVVYTRTYDCNTSIVLDQYNYSGSTEGALEVYWLVNSTWNSSLAHTTRNRSFVFDLFDPVVNVTITAKPGFNNGTINLSVTCYDTITPTLNYNNTHNGITFNIGNHTNNTRFYNSTTAVDGGNIVVGRCSDFVSNVTTTFNITVYYKRFLLIDEILNIPFDVNNISAVKLYYDDNSSVWDLQSLNESTVNFTSVDQQKLRLELVYSDGGIVTRYVDVSLFDGTKDIRLCANREGTTHYEQLIISSVPRKVILESVFANCIVAADFTRFAYESAFALKAYTIETYYQLFTFEGEERSALASLDGSIQATINIDTLEFNQDAYNTKIIREGLQTQRVSDTEFYILYSNDRQDNEEITVTIRQINTGTLLFSDTDTLSPNNYSLTFNTASLSGIDNESLFEIQVLKTDTNGDTSVIKRYFRLGAGIAVLTAGVGFLIALLLNLFGLTLVSTRTTFSYFGIFIIGAAIAILSISTQEWYIIFMEGVQFVLLLFTVILMTKQNSSTVA